MFVSRFIKSRDFPLYFQITFTKCFPFIFWVGNIYRNLFKIKGIDLGELPTPGWS